MFAVPAMFAGGIFVGFLFFTADPYNYTGSVRHMSCTLRYQPFFVEEVEKCRVLPKTSSTVWWRLRVRIRSSSRAS
eukprot:767877-Hanusia_phi.AAC.6